MMAEADVGVTVDEYKDVSLTLESPNPDEEFKRRSSWDGEARRRELCEDILRNQYREDREMLQMKFEHELRLNEMRLAEERERENRRLEEEREKRRLEEERENRRLAEEREKRRLEEERENRRLEEERENRRLSEMRLAEEREKRRSEEERENRRLEHEMRLKQMEIEESRRRDEQANRLKEQELEITVQNNESNNLDATLTARTKRFHDALKGLVGEFPDDPAAVPGYFEYLENQFISYEVDDDVKPKILQASLSTKARLLLGRMTLKQLNDYELLKKALLHEFRISPVLLRERFLSLDKRGDQTYSSLASELHVALTYYIKSRGIDNDFDQLVSLLVADRLKELMHPSCIDFVLAQERTEWLNHEELSRIVDNFMASHDNDCNPIRYSSQRLPNLRDRVGDVNRGNHPATNANNKERDARLGLCFKCHENGHSIKFCPLQKPSPVPIKKIGCCSIFQTNTMPAINAVTTKVSDLRNELVINAREIYTRSFRNIIVDQLPSIPALVDSGAEVCCIREDLVKSLEVIPHRQIDVLGITETPKRVGYVNLLVRPESNNIDALNIAPKVRVWFAVVPQMHQSIIITPSVVELLDSISKYDIILPKSFDKTTEETKVVRDHVDESVLSLVPNSNDTREISVDTSEDSIIGLALIEAYHQEVVETNESCGDSDIFVSSLQEDADFPVVAVQTISNVSEKNEGVDAASFAEEQRSCLSLKPFWQFAERDKKGFFVDNGLLYHRETLWGHQLKQLCLTDQRIPVVLEMGHDAPYSGHMASKSTRQRIRMSFWFPDMENRVPILSIPHGDDLPFSHLVMDCSGPIIPRGNPVAIQPKYNYALVVVDLFSRWPMAYLLCSINAQEVCDILLQIFMTFPISRVISSDCGTTSKRTRFFLEHLGCSSRFHESEHTKISGMVERCNRGLDVVICKLVEKRPQRWYVLLIILWLSLKKGSSSAACIGPCIFIYVACPLAILVDPGGKRESRLAQNGVAFLGRMIASGMSIPCPFVDSLGGEK